LAGTLIGGTASGKSASACRCVSTRTLRCALRYPLLISAQSLAIPPEHGGNSYAKSTIEDFIMDDGKTWENQRDAQTRSKSSTKDFTCACTV
jgi:hypothetical protein